MHAVPKAPDRKKQAPEGSRLWKLQKQGVSPELPPCQLDYLVEFLYEVGPFESSGMGRSALSHTELLAWQVNMRRPLQPWEINMLRRLSLAWIAEAERAEDPEAPAPWSSAPAAAKALSSAASSMRAYLRGLAK